MSFVKGFELELSSNPYFCLAYCDMRSSIIKILVYSGSIKKYVYVDLGGGNFSITVAHMPCVSYTFNINMLSIFY